MNITRSMLFQRAMFNRMQANRQPDYSKPPVLIIKKSIENKMSQFKDVKKDTMIIATWNFGSKLRKGVGFVNTDFNPNDPLVYLSIKGGGTTSINMSELISYQIIDTWLLSRPNEVKPVKLTFDFGIDYGVHSTVITAENAGAAIDFFKEYYPTAVKIYKGRLFVYPITEDGHKGNVNAFE